MSQLSLESEEGGGETQIRCVNEHSFTDDLSGNEPPIEAVVKDASDGDEQHPLRESTASIVSGEAEEGVDVVEVEKAIGGSADQVTNEEAGVDQELEEGINRLMLTPLVLNALESGLEVEKIRRALQWSLEEGIQFASGDDLVNHVLGGDNSGNGANDHLSERNEVPRTPVAEVASDGDDQHPPCESTAEEGQPICGSGNQMTNEEAVVDLELEERIDRLMLTPLVLNALESGLEVEKVRRALQWSLKEGIEFESSDDLVVQFLGGDNSGNGTNDHPSERNEVPRTPVAEDASGGEDQHPSCESAVSIGSEQADESEDVVEEEHPIGRSAIRATNEEAVVDNELEEGINRLLVTPLVLSGLEAGLEVEQVRRALQWSLEQGVEFESGDDLVIHVLGGDNSDTTRPRSDAATSSRSTNNESAGVDSKNPASSAGVTSPSGSARDNINDSDIVWKGLCIICVESDIKTVFLPCKHTLCCAECAKKFNSCPVCKQTISDKLDVFFP